MRVKRTLLLITGVCTTSIALFYLSISQMDTEGKASSSFKRPIEPQFNPSAQHHPQEQHNVAGNSTQAKVNSSLSVCDIGFLIFHSPANSDRLVNVQRSWLSGLCGPDGFYQQHKYVREKANYVFLSSKEDAETQQIDAGCAEEYANLCCKTSHMIQRARELLPGKVWYFKLEDDTFVRPEALAAFLGGLNADDALLVGGDAFAAMQWNNGDDGDPGQGTSGVSKQTFARESIWGPEDGYRLSQNLNFPRGGSGYAMSRGLIGQLRDHSGMFEQVCSDVEAEDIAMGATVTKLGGSIVVHAGFNYRAPIQAFVYDNARLHTEPITWHIMQEIHQAHNTDQMPALRYLTTPPKDFDPAYTGYVESESTSLSLPNPCIDMVGKQQSLLLESYAQLLAPYDKAAIIGFPDHANRGDSSIWIGEVIILRKLKVRIVYEATLPKDYNSALMRQRLSDPKTSCILFHGGGNFGDIYPVHETLREMVASDFPDFPIYSFPQTVWFKKEQSMLQAKQVFENHPSLQLAGRDRASYDILRQNFNVKNGIIALPDSAFMMGNQRDRRLKHPPQFDILFISRTDAEVVKGITNEFYHLLNNTELGEGLTFLADDWIKADVPGIDKELTPNTQKAWMRTVDGMHFLSRAKVVITNRLHGIISSSRLWGKMLKVMCCCF
jgi:exopolysaccharide biosynthesis predicted pyruvyltransferase EpsI